MLSDSELLIHFNVLQLLQIQSSEASNHYKLINNKYLVDVDDDHGVHRTYRRN